MLLWRVSNHTTLNGRGGLIVSARWHTEGRRVVYLAESPPGALLEHLVHLELNPARLPKFYRLLKAEAPDDIPIKPLTATDLTGDWINDQVVTRTAGDGWLASKSGALLRVPSAIVPETYNVLLNPEHVDSSRIRILWHAEYPWDARLLSR